MQQNPWDTPSHRVPRVVGPRVWLWVGTALAVVLLAFAAFFVSIPIFYAFVPGPIRNMERLVEVHDARSYPSEGGLYLTTVVVDTEVTFSEMIGAMFADDKMIVFKDDVTRGGTLEDLQRRERIQMRLSKQQAKEVALSHLGVGQATGDGARITDVAEGTPADGVLRKGDVLLSAQGRPVRTACDVLRVLERLHPGDELSLTVRRDGASRRVRVVTVENPTDPDVAFVGVAMSDVGYRLEPATRVRFKTGRIAGPSAGLMLALALYDRLTPGDLTAGRKVAGTGTIGCNGRVGSIGGIEQKIAGAEAAGVDVFLAPGDNYDVATSAAAEVDVVSISSFDDAIRYLEGLD